MSKKSKNLRIKTNKAAMLLTVVGIIGLLGFVFRWPVVADKVAEMIGKPELSGTISLYADTATGLAVSFVLLYFAFLTVGNPILAVVFAGLGLVVTYFTVKKLF
jgi:hypothetical protein